MTGGAGSVGVTSGELLSDITTGDTTTGDTITLTGVRARGHHGVLDHEKRDGQEFVVDVVLHLDLADAAATDDLTRTVSYADVAADVVRRVEGPALDLIETLAGQIADDALAHEAVQRVEVTVHKPQAPVGVPFVDVAVTLRRSRPMRVAVVALGANLPHQAPGTVDDGDEPASPQQGVLAALDHLDALGDVLAVGDLVLSDPVGGPEQPPYVNTVVLLGTALQPGALLARLHEIEALFGRTREVRWGPRTLDLDLIQHGDPRDDTDTRSADDVLTLPHPRAHERAFVLVPWLSADPDAVLRVGEQVVRVDALVEGMDTSGVRPMPLVARWAAAGDTSC